jgi:transposase-like protein
VKLRSCLGRTAETVRKWVRQAQIDAAHGDEPRPKSPLS